MGWYHKERPHNISKQKLFTFLWIVCTSLSLMLLSWCAWQERAFMFKPKIFCRTYNSLCFEINNSGTGLDHHLTFGTKSGSWSKTSWEPLSFESPLHEWRLNVEFLPGASVGPSAPAFWVCELKGMLAWAEPRISIWWPDHALCWLNADAAAGL